VQGEGCIEMGAAVREEAAARKGVGCSVYSTILGSACRA
jgi:hypothetical protein